MMFSQLCRARPITLWDKFSVRHSANNDPRCTAGNSEQLNNSETNTEESRCQLEHCTFCDYRIRCDLASRTQSQEELASYDWNLKVTENPAYGLSLKSWLEVDEESDQEENALCPLNNVEESPDTLPDCKIPDAKITITSVVDSTSQHDCDAHTEEINMNQNNPNLTEELEPPWSDTLKERFRPENQKFYLPKQSSLTWSVLKHRQTYADATESCDSVIQNKMDSLGVENNSETMPRNTEKLSVLSNKYRLNKDNSFPLSLVKSTIRTVDKNLSIKADLSRRRPVDRNSKEKFQNQSLTENAHERLNKPVDPLQEIAQIKTEESIQEWLARISDSTSKFCAENPNKEKHFHGSAWDLRSDEAKEMSKQLSYVNETETEKANRQNLEKPNVTREDKYQGFNSFYSSLQQSEELDPTTVLCNASKISPANIPMVVMQCSRLHSHIASKPPFQQTSLPMGTLVTALYQETEWLYVQTPHGVEGFISASNCLPIGTINDPAPKRPWEPCDFPIQVNKKEDFSHQKGTYIHTKLPVNGTKQSIPYISTVKMKTNFYTDRYFSNTFKSKDSIKIAKTVTDILRSSPETKVSN